MTQHPKAAFQKISAPVSICRQPDRSGVAGDNNVKMGTMQEFDEARVRASGGISPQPAISETGAVAKGTEKQHVKLGTHIRVDNEREHFAHLPDLSSGRTLEHALKALDVAAKVSSTHYADTWLAEIQDVGCSAAVNFSPEGHRTLGTMVPCDSQMMERQRRLDAMQDHCKHTIGAYEAVCDLLESRLQVCDNRPADRKEAFAAARELLGVGGRIMLTPLNRIEFNLNANAIFGSGISDENAERASSAVRRFVLAVGRWRNEKVFARAVRRLGKPCPNGWTVLSSRGESTATAGSA